MNSLKARRSNRANQGEGGVIAGLTKVSEAIKHVKREKQKTTGILPTQEANPMAPPIKAGHRKRITNNPTSKVPAVPTHLVPPGTITEGPPVLGAYGQTYGFQSFLTSGSKQREGHTNLIHNSTLKIDPALLTQLGTYVARATEPRVDHDLGTPEIGKHETLNLSTADDGIDIDVGVDGADERDGGYDHGDEDSTGDEDEDDAAELDFDNEVEPYIEADGNVQNDGKIYLTTCSRILMITLMNTI